VVVLVEQLEQPLGKMAVLAVAAQRGLRLAQEQAVKEMRVALVNHQQFLMVEAAAVQVPLEQMVQTQ
jgi:hypothetical protein